MPSTFTYPHPAEERFSPGMDPSFRPPCSQQLRSKIIQIDKKQGTVTIEYDITNDFLNPIGSIQGGIVAAMLDDAFSIAILGTLDIGDMAPTLEMKVNFFRPAKPGLLIAKGRITHQGKRNAFVESDLYDSEERLLARASATVALRRMSANPPPKA